MKKTYPEHDDLRVRHKFAFIPRWSRDKRTRYWLQRVYVLEHFTGPDWALSGRGFWSESYASDDPIDLAEACRQEYWWKDASLLAHDAAHDQAREYRNDMLERIEQEGERAAAELAVRLNLPDGMRVRFGGKEIL